MQFRILTAVVIFLGSYLPLSMILLAQDYDYARSGSACWLWEHACQLSLKHPRFSLSIFLLCLACFFITLFVLMIVKPKREIELIDVKYIPTDLMNYTLPYVVSFMSIDYQETSKFVGLVIFLVWMFWITYKSGQVLLNPLLIVLGWRLYDVTYQFPTDRENKKFGAQALSRKEIAAGEVHRQEQLAEILLIKS